MTETLKSAVRAANQIAKNFAALDHDLAVAETLEHIQLFWDPRMKEAIRSASPDDLLPVAKEAIELLWIGSPD